ncbi:YkoP family protein [Fredinandcohnia humi]
MYAKMRSYVITIWTILDPIYYFFTRLTYIDDESNKNIFRVRLTRYKGKSCVLSDGTTIKKNDMLVKIHLHNVILLKELIGHQGETIKARIIYNQVKNSLPSLAKYLHNHPEQSYIKGIIGITALNKGCRRLGFETHSISNKYYLLFKQVVFMPMYCLAVSNVSLKSLRRPPMYLFMSKNRLLDLYYKEE